MDIGYFNINGRHKRPSNIAMQFSKYCVPRIDVDLAGNIMVYLDDVETLGLIKILDINYIHIGDKTLSHIDGNWYKCR